MQVTGVAWVSRGGRLLALLLLLILLFLLLLLIIRVHVRYGLVVRIPGSHPGGPGSIPGNGIFLKSSDEDGIRTHAGRAHWISSPTP